MFQFTRPIIDVGIVCSNFEESVQFYRDLLGLEVVLDIEIPRDVAVGAHLAPTGFRQLRLRAGETLIKLMEIKHPPPPRSDSFQAGVRWLTFLIKDLPSTVGRLKQRGIEFYGEPVSAPDAAHVICAKGPDGMLIELVQVKA
jgi:glyoxylase I family protein